MNELPGVIVPEPYGENPEGIMKALDWIRASGMRAWVDYRISPATGGGLIREVNRLRGCW